MSLPLDLLEQAKHLAKKEPKRPKQASLRRAVSGAYYALFHFLIEKACHLIVSGSGTERDAQRNTLSRAFIHGNMKKISEAFSSAKPTHVWRVLSPAPFPAALRMIASTFVDMQEARHEADYDLTRDFTKAEVLALIAQTENAMNAFAGIQNDPHTRNYLLALLVKKD